MAKLVVEVKSVCVVKMAGICPTPIEKLDLTPTDIRTLQIAYIQRGLIFPNPNFDIHQIIQNLKKSLSLSLDFFPPLAGRLSASLRSIDCNNAGVEFTHASAASVSISAIIQPHYTPEIVFSLFPLNDAVNFEGVSKPLLAVQISELADGLFIACSASHAVVDGTSFWHFLNSWSEISRGSTTISKSPVFDRRSLINGEIPLPTPQKNPWRNDVVQPPPVVRRFFHFSRECLIEMKSKANSEAGTNTISSLQSLTAHLWRSTTRCRRLIRSSSSEEETVMVLVGARGRSPNLPEGYFGNAMYAAKTTMSVAELVEKGVGYAALKINELVAAQTKEEAAIRLRGDRLKNIPIVGVPFIVSSSPRFDVYGNDFGWGKPIGVRSGKSQRVDGMAIVFPAADGGIDVELCLEPDIFRAMDDDVEFAQAFNI